MNKVSSENDKINECLQYTHIPNTCPTHVTRLLDVCDILTHKTDKYANIPSHKTTNAQTHDHTNTLIHIHRHNHKETRTSSQSHRHTPTFEGETY